MNDDRDLGGIDLGRVWTDIAAEVWQRHPGPVERLATRLLRSPGLARALLTSPSLTLPWLISMGITLLLLLVSIWFATLFSHRLATPLIALINAAERVRDGDLSVRVREATTSDEVSFLSRAFNRMTERLGEQQTALQETNAQLDDRRRFTESVLANTRSKKPRNAATLSAVVR